MRHRRALRQQLEERLHDREADAEAVWSSLMLEASALVPALEDLIERVSRRVTWTLWEIAMFEALALEREVEREVGHALCHSCKNHMLHIVAFNEPAEEEELPRSA